MQKTLSEQYPVRANDIKKLFEALNELDPIRIMQVLKQDFLDVELNRIGDFQKESANTFARDMSESLGLVRKQGITCTTKIAKKFNELGIKPRSGGLWSHSAVSDLIQRRRQLGLE
ncbi:MAG: hypothetical protein AAGA64_12310 [Bacteroidota bacterium]